MADHKHRNAQARSEFKELPIYRALRPGPPPAAPRYWNMARQRYCRRLTRYRITQRVSADPVGKPAAQTRAESRVLDLRKLLRERDRLSAGGRWIRTLGPPSEGQRFSRLLFPNMRVRHRRFLKRSPAPSSSCFFQLQIPFG